MWYCFECNKVYKSVLHGENNRSILGKIPHELCYKGKGKHIHYVDGRGWDYKEYWKYKKCDGNNYGNM